jgi:hypothetical protein
MRKMTTAVAVAALALVAAAAAPASAEAHCGVGDSGISFNRYGDPAKFRGLTAMDGMNCPSARYVLNKWLRRKYERSWSHRLPVTFYDGYVTWYCHKRSRIRWECNEYDSYTTFRFIAYLL